MKKHLVLLFILLLLVGCSDEEQVKPDSPMNAAFLMKYQIGSQNFDEFQKLFYDGTDDTISKDEFEELREISTAGANFKDFELITMDNGEMLLIEFAPLLDDQSEYKIVNVKIVPKEMRALFEN